MLLVLQVLLMLLLLLFFLFFSLLFMLQVLRGMGMVLIRVRPRMLSILATASAYQIFPVVVATLWANIAKLLQFGGYSSDHLRPGPRD
jgi:hypothetical protein